MRFFTNQHKYYCGIDLHANKMYVCVIDAAGAVVLHHNIVADAERFLELIRPYREDIVVGVECMFCWYWLADLCAEENIAFVLGHALYMKAISGGKVKNDKLDSEKLAMMLRGGMFPEAYVYPRGMRAARDLMRRRLFLVRKRSELLSHVQMTHQQYNLANPGKKIAYKSNRAGVAEQFSDAVVQRMVESDLAFIDSYSKEIGKLEWFILKTCKKNTDNALLLSLLRTIPGIGPVLSLTLLYEIHAIERFSSVQRFASYARLVKPQRTSMGKNTGGAGKKIGNQHLKWAFSEAVVLFLRQSEMGKNYLKRLRNKHPKAKALSILAHKLGRSVYFMLERREAFDEKKFIAT